MGKENLFLTGLEARNLEAYAREGLPPPPGAHCQLLALPSVAEGPHSSTMDPHSPKACSHIAGNPRNPLGVQVISYHRAIPGSAPGCWPDALRHGEGRLEHLHLYRTLTQVRPRWASGRGKQSCRGRTLPTRRVQGDLGVHDLGI